MTNNHKTTTTAAASRTATVPPKTATTREHHPRFWKTANPLFDGPPFHIGPMLIPQRWVILFITHDGCDIFSFFYCSCRDVVVPPRVLQYNSNNNHSGYQYAAEPRLLAISAQETTSKSTKHNAETMLTKAHKQQQPQPQEEHVRDEDDLSTSATRYPAVYFHLPQPLGGSLEVHPRHKTSRTDPWCCFMSRPPPFGITVMRMTTRQQPPCGS